jgi:hypothetical protein
MQRQSRAQRIEGMKKTVKVAAVMRNKISKSTLSYAPIKSKSIWPRAPNS